MDELSLSRKEAERRFEQHYGGDGIHIIVFPAGEPDAVQWYRYSLESRGVGYKTLLTKKDSWSVFITSDPKIALYLKLKFG